MAFVGEVDELRRDAEALEGGKLGFEELRVFGGEFHGLGQEQALRRGGALFHSALGQAASQKRVVVGPDSARFSAVVNGHTEIVDYRMTVIFFESVYQQLQE